MAPKKHPPPRDPDTGAPSSSTRAHPAVVATDGSIPDTPPITPHISQHQTCSNPSDDALGDLSTSHVRYSNLEPDELSEASPTAFPCDPSLYMPAKVLSPLPQPTDTQPDCLGPQPQVDVGKPVSNAEVETPPPFTATHFAFSTHKYMAYYAI